MFRIYLNINNELKNEQIIKLSKQDEFYVNKVIRLRENQEIEIITNKQIIVAIKKQDEYIIIKNQKIVKTNAREITMAIPLLKNSNFELALQKNVEIGVDFIIPFQSRNSVVKIKNSKKDRWEKIVKEAIEQSKTNTITKLEQAQNLLEINFQNYDLIICAFENENMQKIRNYQEEIIKAHKILCITGPEGGFTSDEIKTLQTQYKTKIISLGKNILRAETASIVLSYEIVNLGEK